MIQNNPAFIKELVDKIESTKFNKSVFEQTGIFIIKNAIPPALIKEWKEEWNNFYEQNLLNARNVNVYNPVALQESLPDKLSLMYRNNILLDHVEEVFGENIALYNHRFVIKDKFSSGEVFLHHDFCYQTGYPNKVSFFVPLSHSGKRNGGLTFYLGTHKYGYLGDAGEIQANHFKETWPEVTPDLEPGDFAIMNSLLWHKSGINEVGIDRVIADIIYQPADDPSSRELLRGKWQTDIFLDRIESPIQFFKRSRISRIIDLENKLKH
ncbi:MAG: phytanoyl-CoA dioxygenase family protein [Nostoc sp.]|uniref:phytanoyl-CoA dioxygenase family protein n=1 Tax=Nostoc sp. TaxID=1180 RepID=UPI002FEFA5CE